MQHSIGTVEAVPDLDPGVADPAVGVAEPGLERGVADPLTALGVDVPDLVLGVLEPDGGETAPVCFCLRVPLVRAFFTLTRSSSSSSSSSDGSGVIGEQIPKIQH